MAGRFYKEEPFRKGLNVLQKAYSFEVRDYSELLPEGVDKTSRPHLWTESRNQELWGHDTGLGPGGHAISWKRRILWLDTQVVGHADWLHEVAHLVVVPPWESGGPDTSNEMSAIFTWERAVALELRRQKIWNQKDLAGFRAMQNTYVATNQGQHWYEILPTRRAQYLKFTRKTLRGCGLLGAQDRPTFQKPIWTDDVQARWYQYEDLLLPTPKD